MTGVSRGKLIFVVILFSVLLFSWTIYRDLMVPFNRDGSDDNSQKSSVTVEKLRLDREISGDVWSLESDRAEKYEKEIVAWGVTVNLLKRDGQIWHTVSPRANLYEKTGIIIMNDPEGTSEGKNFSFRWKAPKAILDQNTGEVTFPEGIFASSDKTILRAGWGKASNDGSIILENGAEINWIIQE